MATKVVNIRKEKYDVFIGRGSLFGNPYTHLPLGETHATFQVKTRDESIEKYKEYFYRLLEEDSEFLDAVLLLKDKTLGCWCKPLNCHGDFLALLADQVIKP